MKNGHPSFLILNKQSKIMFRYNVVLYCCKEILNNNIYDYGNIFFKNISIKYSNTLVI